MARGRVTLKDVAAGAGVSRATVSLVVRNSPAVAADTRKRVLASMARLGYVYHRGAASLRSKRSHTVGLIVTEVSNPFFAELTSGIESEMGVDGYVLLLAQNSESLDKQARVLQNLWERAVDGVVLCAAQGTTADALGMLTAAGIPVVLATRHTPGVEAGYVGADNALGAEMATRHLLEEHGARRLAFVGGPEDSSSRVERRRGVEAALARRNRTLTPELSVPSAATREGGHTAASLVLRRSVRPDAILCYNDIVAFGVLDAIRGLGLKAGVDVLVCGFDDIADAVHQDPPLTTVATRPREIGERAGRQLKNLIEYSTAVPEFDLLAPTLAIRESCGCRGRAGNGPH